MAWSQSAPERNQPASPRPTSQSHRKVGIVIIMLWKMCFSITKEKKHNLSISIEKKQRPLMSKCKVFAFFSFFRELLQVKSRVSAVPMLPLQKLCWTLRIGLSSIAVRINSGSTILNSNSGCSEPAAIVCRMSVKVVDRGQKMFYLRTQRLQ